MKSKFCFFLLMFFSFTTAMAQNHTMTGTVKSENGETLLGVTNHLRQEKEDGSAQKWDCFVRESRKQTIRGLQILIGSG